MHSSTAPNVQWNITVATPSCMVEVRTSELGNN
jgi:hypothetical protein